MLIIRGMKTWIRPLSLLLMLSPCMLAVSASVLAAGSDQSATVERAEAAATAPEAAATEAAVPPPRIPPNPDRDAITDLVRLHSPGTEVVWLDTGTEQVLSLYLSEGAGKEHGGIMLFPDQDSHPEWPAAVRPLREGLADAGWNTLALYLPRAPAAPTPARTLPVLASVMVSPPGEAAAPAAEPPPPPDAGTPPESPAAEEATAPEPQQEAEPEPPEPYAQVVDRYARAAHAFLRDNGDQRIVVLGIGSGAAWAAQYVQAYQGEQNLRLVLVNARQPDTATAPDLMQLLPQIETTVLDLYHGPRPEPYHVAAGPEQRKRLARHKQLTRFHQRRLPATPFNWKQEERWLVRHVKGMLQRYIVEADSARTDHAGPKGRTPRTETAPGMTPAAKAI